MYALMSSVGRFVVGHRKIFRRWLLVALLITKGAACTRLTARAPSLTDGDIAPKAELVTVPFFAQAERNDCGPAALAMMLGATGLVTTPAELAPKVYTPGREGTLQADIVQATRREGRLGIELRDLARLLAELDAGNPVLVLQNLGLKQWPIWHYAVAMGYDLESRTLFLHSGKQARFPLTFSAFERTWDDAASWGLTVTNPDHLPATAREDDILKAAHGLEQAGKHDAATLAYGAVLERWPNNLPALMGWGNARYAEGDHKAAGQAFRQAVILRPDAAEAWNNLAYSLMAQHRLDEALSAAQEAVKRGGPHRAAAEATLLEIEAKRG